jgi:hypothetical protein
MLAAITLGLCGAAPALAQVDGVNPDFDTARTCAISDLVLGGKSDSFSRMIDTAAALSGRPRSDLEADFDTGATNLRTALFQRRLDKDSVVNIVSSVCPQVFGIPAPEIIYDPAPPIASADLAAYRYGIGRVWNCQAVIPETLDHDADVHTYRLRFSVGLDKNLRLSGYVDAYQQGQDNPFARYPLSGWPYRSDWAPSVVAELGQPSSGESLPGYVNWTGFWMTFGFKPTAGSDQYYLTGQIDRRSDSATWVNLESCYAE